MPSSSGGTTSRMIFRTPSIFSSVIPIRVPDETFRFIMNWPGSVRESGIPIVGTRPKEDRRHPETGEHTNGPIQCLLH